MKKIIIIGSGGHGAELDDYIRYNEKVTGVKELEIIGYLDDNPLNYGNYKFGAPLIGGVRDHKVRTDVEYLMGIANLTYRKLFVDQYSAAGASFISLIHRTAYISDSASIGNGVVFCAKVNIGPNAKVGKFNIFK